MGTRRAPPGFQGLLSDKPVIIYHRHLPHWRQHGATYFVTFRQHDSQPRQKLDELAAWRREWEAKHLPRSRTDWQSVLPSTWEELSRETARRVEHWLDQGMGSCRLKDASIARFIQETMHRFDGSRYELGCYVVMPNHVHVVVRPTEGEVDPLEKILQTWKRFSSREINRVLGQNGPFWQEESYDRIVRDEGHLERAIRYIGDNPAKARLIAGAIRWLRPEWEQAGWTFANEVGRIGNPSYLPRST